MSQIPLAFQATASLLLQPVLRVRTVDARRGGRRFPPPLLVARGCGRAQELSETLVMLRQSGLALSQIAAATNVSMSAISMELARRNVTIRRVSLGRKSKSTWRGTTDSAGAGPLDPADARVLELRERGKTVHQIAIRVNEPSADVWTRLVALNLTTPVRSRSRP